MHRRRHSSTIEQSKYLRDELSDAIGMRRNVRILGQPCRDIRVFESETSKQFLQLTSCQTLVPVNETQNIFT